MILQFFEFALSFIPDLFLTPFLLLVAFSLIISFFKLIKLILDIIPFV